MVKKTIAELEKENAELRAKKLKRDKIAELKRERYQ